MDDGLPTDGLLSYKLSIYQTLKLYTSITQETQWSHKRVLKGADIGVWSSCVFEETINLSPSSTGIRNAPQRVLLRIVGAGGCAPWGILNEKEIKIDSEQTCDVLLLLRTCYSAHTCHLSTLFLGGPLIDCAGIIIESILHIMQK